ncbi:hypothetical protein [Streptomyces sp. NPDC088748]|uniref:hypothetical protein n=1 Tax=Streptomyces sp. NPDC088748 TaxID=3365887 RepID=UPI003819DE31
MLQLGDGVLDHDPTLGLVVPRIGAVDPQRDPPASAKANTSSITRSRTPERSGAANLRAASRPRISRTARPIAKRLVWYGSAGA